MTDLFGLTGEQLIFFKAQTIASGNFGVFKMNEEEALEYFKKLCRNLFFDEMNAKTQSYAFYLRCQNRLLEQENLPLELLQNLPTFSEFGRKNLTRLVQDWSVQEFTYLDLERCRNTSFVQRKPFVEEYWNRNDAFYCDGNRAESFSDFFIRVNETIEKIKSSKHQFTAVFTHGQFIRTMMWILLKGKTQIESNTMRNVFNFLSAILIPNAAIVEVECIESKTYISNIITEHLSSELLSY